MAQLTWRELSAPDFSGSLRGTELFSNLLNRAFSGIQEGVDTFDKSKTDRVNNELALRIAGAQDSEAAKALAASLAADPNAKRISGQTAALAAARPGQLISQAAGELGLKDAQYASTQMRTTDARAPQLMQLRTFMQNDDKAGFNKYLADNPGLMEGLGFKTVNDLTSTLQNDLKGALDITGERQDQKIQMQEHTWKGESHSWDRTSHNWAVEDRNLATQADTLYAGIQESIDPNNPETVRNALFNGPLASADGRVRAAVYRRISDQYPGVFTPGQVGLSAADIAGATGGGVGVAAAGMTYGGGQLPGSIKTVGDLINNKSNLLNKLGATPVGLYQINAGTWQEFGPSALGENWKNADVRDPRVQDKVAKAIWNSARGSAQSIAGRWASISPTQARAMVGKSWEQVRDIISRGETRSSASTILATIAGGKIATGLSAQGKSDAGTLIENAGGAKTSREAADILRGMPAFKGVSYTFLNSKINDIVERSKVDGQPTITFGQAATILNDAVMDPDAVATYAKERENGNGFFTLHMGKNPFNDQMIKNEIDRARTGGVVEDYKALVDKSGSMQTLSAAQANYQSAAAAYQSVLKRSILQPKLESQLPMLKANLKTAEKALNNAQKNTQEIASPPRQVVGKSAPPMGFLDGISSIASSFWKNITSP